MTLLTHPDAWLGGSFDLAIELGPPDLARIQAAMEALWDFPDLDGIYLDRERQTNDQLRYSADQIDHKSGFGIARLPDGKFAPCDARLVEEGDDGSDWLYLCLPLGGLRNYFPTASDGISPTSLATEQAIVQLEQWIANIGQFVCKRVPFRLGVIGFLLFGEHHAEDFELTGIPVIRGRGLLWPNAGRLEYWPRNQTTGPFWP
jgi:hypothetical protein